MVALTTPICDFGWKAPDFELLGIDEKNYTYSQIAGENGTLVMFICNHCPYVKSVIHRIVEDCQILQDSGIGIIAIMSNDVNDPKYGHEDSFENMYMMILKKLAKSMMLSVPQIFLDLIIMMNFSIEEGSKHHNKKLSKMHQKSYWKLCCK